MKKLFLLALLALVSCTTNETPRPTATPTGPAIFQVEEALGHAEEFSNRRDSREAGSEEELAAAVYISAHLQQAGYVVELDAVPVAKTVRSTNVIALPPSGEPPDVVVVVAYSRDNAVWIGDGESIGTFLELARALRVARPDHSVAFAALGAEGADINGVNYLGARRLVQYLVEKEVSPEILEAANSKEGDSLFVNGDSADELLAIASTGRKTTVGGRDDDPFTAAGFDYTVTISSGVKPVGKTFLEYLVEQAG